MPKPLAYWEAILEKALRQKTRYARLREELAPFVLMDQPSKWVRNGSQWIQKHPAPYRQEIARFQRARVMWASVNRALARIERSILHAQERLACRKNTWHLVRRGAKETARETRRRCTNPG